MIRRTVAALCLLAPLASVAPAHAARVPHDPPTCRDGSYAPTGNALTTSTSYGTCGIGALRDLGAFMGPDDYAVQGAKKLGALSWDIGRRRPLGLRPWPERWAPSTRRRG